MKPSSPCLCASVVNSTQRKLVLPGESTALVLATVHGARSHLALHGIVFDEDDIAALVDDRKLMAWNIGLGEARDLRVLPDSILAYVQHADKPHWTFGRSLDQVIGQLMMIAGNKPFVTGVSLKLLLNCSSTHVIHLVDAAALRMLPNTTYGTGPYGSPLITVPSLIAFFKSRAQ